MTDDIAKPTRVYGCSDDLLEMEGGYNAEHGCYDTGCGLFLSDGTVLFVIYAPDEQAIWKIEVKEKGTLFDRLDVCCREDADPYSDQVFFLPGIVWAYAVNCSREDLERVR